MDDSIDDGAREGSEAVSILCNGEQLALAKETSLPAFLSRVGHDARTVAIEYNGTILRREQFGGVTLRHGDRLEIVRFVQGGSLLDAPRAQRLANS